MGLIEYERERRGRETYMGQKRNGMGGENDGSLASLLPFCAVEIHLCEHQGYATRFSGPLLFSLHVTLLSLSTATMSHFLM